MIEAEGVEDEVAVLAGMQLVAPMLNARSAVNAANARWGSPYDALYGTDLIPEPDGEDRTAVYNGPRAQKVTAWARAILDEHFPLESGSHEDASGYVIADGRLSVMLEGGSSGLADPGQYVGNRRAGAGTAPEGALLVHHGLPVELQVDREDPIGQNDAAGTKNVVLEAAVSAIMALECSVEAVDAEDTVVGYRNWLRLNQGRLTAEVNQGGDTFTRRLAEDRRYTGADSSWVSQSCCRLAHCGSCVRSVT